MNIIPVMFSSINNDIIIEINVKKRSFALFPKLAKFDLSISSFRFETPILVYGLMLLNISYILVGTSFLTRPRINPIHLPLK